MNELISFPVYRESLGEYSGMEELARSCDELGCGGIEAIWGGDDSLDLLPEGLAVGYHLLFYPDWLDFWRGDEAALLRKFGSRDACRSFYGGEGRDTLIRQYRQDLDRARKLNAQYAVFHVSDVSIEEGYTYRWEHSDTEVIDAAAELINAVTDGRTFPFPILVENQWWPGFTFTDPALTEHLLDAIHTCKKGILLDTGHLMNTNLSLRTQREGAAYILQMLDRHGSLCDSIRGVHLHQSLSGAYVRAHTGALPENCSPDYLTRFGDSYGHILKIDRHEPWTAPCVREVVDRISPEFLIHELTSRNRADRERAVRTQRAALWGDTPTNLEPCQK